MKRHIPFFFMLCCLAFFAGCAAANQTHSVAEVMGNPSAISGQIVKDSSLDGLRLENLTLRNTTFWNCTGSGVTFRNVVFENCRFINTKLKDVAMENVTFKGGLLTCERDADNLARRTVFTSATFRNVVFDGANFDNPVLELTPGSSLTLREMNVLEALEALIRGKDITLVIEKCTFMRAPALTAISGKSSLKVSDSSFDRATFGSSVFDSVSFARCMTYSGPVYLPPAGGGKRR